MKRRITCLPVTTLTPSVFLRFNAYPGCNPQCASEPNRISSDFPFDFINGISARFDTSPETFLYILSFIIPKLHRNFNNFPANSARHIASNTKEATYLREESTFPYYIDTPPPFTSDSEPDFEQFQTSSGPRWYCQETQLPDPVNDLAKKHPCCG